MDLHENIYRKGAPFHEQTWLAAIFCVYPPVFVRNVGLTNDTLNPGFCVPDMD